MEGSSIKRLGSRTLCIFNPEEHMSWSIDCKTYQLTHKSGYPIINLQSSRSASDVLDDIFHFSGEVEDQYFVIILKLIFNDLFRRQEGWTRFETKKAINNYVRVIEDYCLKHNIDETNFLIK